MRLLAILLASIGLQHGTQALQAWQPIRELRKQTELEAQSSSLLHTTDTDPKTLYPAHNLSVPIDHFHNDTTYAPHTNATFPLRYWFDSTHYLPGGPVLVLCGGETSGAGRLRFLQKGIVAQLARATHGLAVVLEHRYYGTSHPTANLTTESLRFLTTDQALADTAYFAEHVVFPGLEDVDLRAGGTAWIAYGGSYAGAFAAFLRKLYPETFWGAISSSGVTQAIVDYWEYYEAQRRFAPEECVGVSTKLTNLADNILIMKKGTEYVGMLKGVYGLGNVTHDDDFAMVLGDILGAWQSRNWDPAIGDKSFGRYCGNLTSDELLWPAFEDRRGPVNELLEIGGYGEQVEQLSTRMLNHIGWINATTECDEGKSQDECFTNRNATFYQQDGISEWVWRSWMYQVCTQWGYFQTGNSPPNQLPLVSRLINIPYVSYVCTHGFNITTPPDVSAINKHGGFNFSYPRLAIIDGEADPWRAATPHALVAPDRESTVSEPFILIKGGVHHWDENGLFDNETTAELPPAPVKEVQEAEVRFVRAWMAEWEKEKRHGSWPGEL